MIIAKGGRIELIEGPSAEVNVEAVKILHAIYEKVKEVYGEDCAEDQLVRLIVLAKMSPEEILSCVDEEGRKKS